jgi:uncharacterized protein YdaU (DUF1376 family)
MKDLKADIWMPQYIADYLADTAYLTTEQSGAYLHLLMAYWRNGPPPDNDSILASITKMSPDAWSNARASLEHYFEVVDGRWRNKRADAEIAEAQQNRKKNHDKALRAASARWGKHDAMLGACLEHSDKQSSKVCPSPSPNKEPSLRSGSSKQRGSRLPADWSLTDEYRQAAAATRPDWTEQHTATVAAGFRDYWIAQPGAKGVKLDWLATWRNWCRNDRSSPMGKPASKHDLSGMNYKAGVSDDGRF